jgi:hypothetical protein
VSPSRPPVGQLGLLDDEEPTATEHPRLRVLIPCSKWKSPSEDLATQHQLDEHREETHARLSSLALPARELYTGRAYLRALRAVDRFASARPDIPVELHIASAGYGIVRADDRVVPYEAVMGSGARGWAERGRKLGMPDRARFLVEDAEATIIALSQPYFIGAGIVSMEPARGLGVVIGAGPEPKSERLRWVIASRPQARALGTTEREVASVVLSAVLDMIAIDGLDRLRDLPTDPRSWVAG